MNNCAVCARLGYLCFGCLNPPAGGDEIYRGYRLTCPNCSAHLRWKNGRGRCVKQECYFIQVRSGPQ